MSNAEEENFIEAGDMRPSQLITTHGPGAIINMKNDGFENFIEVGPKNILTNFNKKIVPNLNTINSESLIESIV